MKVIKICLKIVLITTALAGCSAMVGSKNIDFISGQSQATGEKTSILICRPSSLFQAFNSAGITINSSPVTEIGSGEIYSIDVAKSNKLDLLFTLPVTDVIKNLWEKPKTFSLRLNPDVPTYFVFLSVDFGDIDASPNMAGNPAKETVWTVTSNWMATTVDAKTFYSKCNASSPIFLAMRTLPKITPTGVLATSSGFIVSPPSPIKPTNSLDLKAASQKANPAGLPLSKSNQISLSSMIGLGIFGYDSAIYSAYLDQRSAIKNQDIIEVNLIKSFAVEQSIGGAPYNAEVEKVGLDCKNLKYRLIESAKYLDGSPTSPEIDHKNFASVGLASWTTPPPEKLEDKALKMGCRIQVLNGK